MDSISVVTPLLPADERQLGFHPRGDFSSFQLFLRQQSFDYLAQLTEFRVSSSTDLRTLSSW